MMLAKMTVALCCISVLLLFRLNFTNAVECKGTTIKYNPEHFLAMKNCTSILGSLIVASVWDLNVNETAKYQLRNLKEITGYLLLFDLPGLKSPGHLFPNLSVIRGRQLAMSFALIIFNAPHLQTVDFNSLISIQRGYVLIENCPLLCFYRTIDWEALTDEDEDDLNAGKGNRIQKSSNVTCPTTESCRSCDPRNCWSAAHCQKNKESVNHVIPVEGLDCHESCPGECVNNTLEGCVKGMKCHELCLGGCVNNTVEGCNVCSKLKWNGKCVEECPSDLFLYRDTMRCINATICKEMYKSIPFNGECRKFCPVQYSQFDPLSNEYHRSECFKCEIKCPHRCPGLEIRGPTELEYFYGCTIVDGSLSIRLGLNMTDIYEKLEESLGNIETINGALKIYRSFSLTSLSFFRSLTKIDALNATVIAKGSSENQTEYRNPYALEVIENENLQTLFDWREKRQFEIVGGGMLFHLNSKLCLKEIHTLQNITIYDPKNDTIHSETNGYDEVCHATGIYAFHVVQSHNTVRIYWNISDFGLDKKLMGYFVYYIEAPSHNITYFSGLDACSTQKFRPSPSKYMDLPMISKQHHGEFWQSVFVPLEDLQKEQGHFRTNLTGLKQYTQYAYYVRTQLSIKLRDQLINVTQGQSQVKYFTTRPDRPRPPFVRTKEKTNVSITLTWHSSTPEHELVEKYIIDVYALVDERYDIDERDYCNDPKVDKKAPVNMAPEVICCRDQMAYLEFFQLDTNKTCGDMDPLCEKAFEFVLFQHHVENALLMADLEKDPSERYQYKIESYESLAHHKGAIEPIQRKHESDSSNNSSSSKYYLHSHIIDDKHMDRILVPNLKPFNLYAFYVYACNQVANCSDYFFHSDRTEPSLDADDIVVTAIPDKRRTDNITVTIQPPKEPNSVTVAYEIESYDYLRNTVNVTCITRKHMESMNYSIRFENLLYGTHSFRIRSLSIGEDGEFSDWVMVDVDQLSDSKYKWGIALAFISIAAIIIITTVYQKVRAYRCPRIHDMDYLLFEPRDSDELAHERELPQSKQTPPSVAWPSTHSSVPSENIDDQFFPDDGIQMTVFKSNISRSMMSPSTSNYHIPTGASHASPESTLSPSQPNESFAKRMLKAVQVTPKTEDIEDALLSSSNETESHFADSTDFDFPFFAQ